MDTRYTCQEPECDYSERRKPGGIYPANLPMHHDKVMLGEAVPGQDLKFLDTQSHRIVISSGGLLLVPLEELSQEDLQERDPETMSKYDEAIILTLDEILSLSETLSGHLRSIQQNAPTMAAYFDTIATEWLKAFTPEAEKLHASIGEHWWPMVRNEARHCLIRLINDKSNPIINRWRAQCFDNEAFPRSQQETVLERRFKILYYHKFPAPSYDDIGDGPEEVQ